MMRVVGCPSCEQNLAVEEFVPATAMIQCPFCQASSSVADMAQSRLPVAIVLEMPAVEVADDVPDTDDALDDQPLGEDGELRGALNIGSGGSGEAADRVASQGQFDGSPDSEAAAVATEVESSPEGAEQDSEYTLEGEASAQEQASTEEADTASESAPVPARSLTKRRRKRGPSMVALMVQVVLGGVIGIGGTILGLLWLPGSLRRDPFEVGHTLGKVAPWIVPAHYRPTSTASSSGGEANAKQENSRNKPKASRTKATEVPKNKAPKNDTEAVAALPDGAFERQMKELETKLNESDDSQEEPADDLEMPILGSKDPNNDQTNEEELTLDLPEDSEEMTEEPAAKTDGEGTNEDEPASEPATESEPTESEPEVPAKDTENEVTDEKGEVAPAAADEAIESTEPPAEESKDGESKGDESADNKSSAVAKAAQASEELRRVLADTEAPKAQQREAAQSFYSAICGLSDVSDSAAVDVLVKAASDQLHSQVIAHGAASFLDRAETVGKPLVVVGKVTAAKAIGPMIEIKINLATKEPREVVLVAAAEGDPPAQPDDEIVAIGLLTDCKATPIEGYEGTGKVLAQARMGRISAQ